jgi:hypothetical protein
LEEEEMMQEVPEDGLEVLPDKEDAREVKDRKTSRCILCVHSGDCIRSTLQ